MSKDQLWAIVEDQRRRLVSFLGRLDEAEWRQSSLCDGWTVKDVAAHIAVVPHAPSLGQVLGMAVLAGGSFNRVNHDIATRYAAARSTSDLVADLRDNATSRDLPSVTSVENLAMDIVVHGQDMAIPLGRDLPVTLDAARNGLERAWSMGWPFRAQKKLAGYRLEATDTDWSAGEGPVVRGTALTILLLATGRVGAALPLLDGPGVHRLAVAVPR